MQIAGHGYFPEEGDRTPLQFIVSTAVDRVLSALDDHVATSPSSFSLSKSFTSNPCVRSASGPRQVDEEQLDRALRVDGGRALMRELELMVDMLVRSAASQVP